MRRTLSLLLSPLPVAFLLFTRCASSWPLHDHFTESLHLRPLPVGRVQSTFTFNLSSSIDPFDPDAVDGRSFHLLPPSLLTLIHYSPLRVKELHLSFNKGRWDHGRWGMPTFLEQGQEWGSEAVATGIEAWVRYAAPPSSPAYAAADAAALNTLRSRWVERGKEAFHDLLASLSGQFCSTLSASGSREAIASPLALARTLFDSKQGKVYDDRDEEEDLLYTLSIPETPCTEVLYRMLTLLPCRANAGLASLLSPHKWLEQEWHGIDLVVRRTGIDQRGWDVEIRVGGVWNGVVHNGKRDFSMTSIFGKPLASACALAEDSFVSLLVPPDAAGDGASLPPSYEVEPALAAETEGKETEVDEETPEDDVDEGSDGPLLASPSGSLARDLSSKGSLRYLTTSASLPDYIQPPHAGQASGLDVSLSWPNEGPYNYSSSPTIHDHTLHVSRSYISSSLSHAIFSLRIKNQRLDTSRRIVYHEVLPWFLLPSLHSASLSVTPLEVDPSSPFIRFDSDFTSPQKALLNLEYIPSIPRVSSGVLELELRIPAGSELTWEMQVGREMIRYEEHNPDAHRGLEVGAGTAWEIVDDEEELKDWNEASRNGTRKKRTLRTTEGGMRSVFKTQVGLVEVAVPDFSMPYNVIIFTSTLLALFAGSAVNLLTRSFKDVAVPPMP